MKTHWLAAAAVAALITAPTARAADAPTDLTQAPRMGSWGFDLSGRDAAKSAGASFFDYANGAYVDRLAIPADRSAHRAGGRSGTAASARRIDAVEAAGRAAADDVGGAAAS